jgi:predicted ATPase
MILTPDQRLRVFVSSTLQELTEERTAAKEAISALRLTPILFELGARPHPPRDLYRAYLEQSHIFIGIYWQRYGWVAPDMDISGLEDEFRLSTSKPSLIYIKTPAPEREPRLNSLINEIENKSGVSFKNFSTPQELGELIQNDLALMLTERFQMVQTSLASMPAPTEERIRNLPLPATPLVGRQVELAGIQELLVRPGVRIVTLHGPGGIGKTRLAIEVARSMADQFQNGVCFVPLAPVTDPNLVPLAIAQSLDLLESKAEAIRPALYDYLAQRNMLLVLDNFEQVIQSAEVVAELVTQTPKVKVLVTSRSALHLSGEYQYPVRGLDLPPAEEAQTVLPGDLEELAAYPAVTLFVQSAQRHKPEFRLTLDNAKETVELCRHLDGLPLAIELASARIKLFTPQAMHARLEKSLQWLTAGARDLPPRQQTLRGAIEWSYSLLEKDAQSLLASLGVFQGSFSLDAAEAICNPHGELDTLNLISTLIDNSLLQQVELSQDETRFAMLGTIREFALEKLEKNPDAREVHRRHADYYQQLTEAAAPELKGPRQLEWMDRLDQEYDNIRTAVQWSLENGEMERAASIAWNLWYFWWNRGYHTEARYWMEAISQQLEFLPLELRGRALLTMGVVYTMQGEYERLTEKFDQMNEDLHQAGNLSDEALGLCGVGIVFINMNKPGDAAEHFERGLSLYREAGDKWGIAFALALTGQLAISQQNFWRATSLLAESAALFWETGDKNGIIFAQYELAMALLMQNDPEWAYSLLQSGLSLAYSLKQKQNIAHCLEGLAGVAAARGEAERSARLWGAADSIREASHNPVTPSEQVLYSPFITKVRSDLGEAAYLESWRAGRLLTISKAVAFASNT